MAKLGAYWDTNPTEFGKQVYAQVYQLTKRKAEQVFEYCVALSPVLTGSYRASWFISEGEPIYKYIDNHGSSSPIGPPSLPKVSSKFYRKLYITNGAPYAQRIEYGWSSKAPNGVVRQALMLASLYE